MIGTIDELMLNRIGSLFFCHGLGHLLGLRTHDVGGYNKGCPERLPGIYNILNKNWNHYVLEEI